MAVQTTGAWLCRARATAVGWWYCRPGPGFGYVQYGNVPASRALVGHPDVAAAVCDVAAAAPVCDVARARAKARAGV